MTAPAAIRKEAHASCAGFRYLEGHAGGPGMLPHLRCRLWQVSVGLGSDSDRTYPRNQGRCHVAVPTTVEGRA